MRESVLPTTILRIVHSAILAPSSHNTQPWFISYHNDSLFIHVDTSRKLLVVDPTDRELYVGIGCCIANAMIEAVHLGLDTQLVLFPDLKSPNLVAEFRFEKKKNTDFVEDLASHIPARLSNRSKYIKGKKIPEALIKYGKKISHDWEVEFTVTQDKKAKDQLAQLTKEAMVYALSNVHFRDELTHWVRHNWTKKHDGMPGYAIGLPAVPSILFPALIHAKSMPATIAQNEFEMINDSSGVGILSISQDDKESWVKAGIALEHIWLKATSLEISFSLLSGAVEVDTSRKKVQQVIKSRYIPSVFFRIGYATQPAFASPRRLIDDVLIPYRSFST